VEWLAADAADPVQTRTACQGATVVYHCAQPPYQRWAAQFPALTQSIAEAAAAAGARLVYADNLYAYGPVGGALTEELPAWATTSKGRVRALMAERLLAAHRSGTLQVAIGRSSDYYGPGGANSVVGDILFGAAVVGNRARWLGRLDLPHSLNYLPDVARALRILGTRPEALGGVWHLPAAEPVTGRAFVELVADALGRPVKVTATSRLALRVAGVFDPRARESAEMLYQWERPFVVDASKFQRAFGPFQPTPHQQAVATTLAWFQQRAGRTRR
jgi:nucleoside-diphosphate-sugar epimerase